MVCKNCGNQISDNAHICGHCGTILSIPVPPIPKIPVPPIPTPPIPGNPLKNDIPPEYRPLSGWAFFWLKVLFCVPVVGLIFLLVFTFDGSNLSRRNFARSYWCGLLVALIIVVVFLVIAFAFLGGMNALDRLF